MTLYCIGDVHGCYSKLCQLLELVGPGAEDTLWFTGDLINRGEDSIGVLRLVKSLKNAQVVLGNHEIGLLIRKEQHPVDTMHALRSASDGEELWAWIASWPFLLVDHQRRVLLTHAGFCPFWQLEEGIKYSALLSSYFTPLIHPQLAKVYKVQSLSWSKELTGKGFWYFLINAFTRMRFCNWQDKLLDFTEVGKGARNPMLKLTPWFVWLDDNLHYTVLFGHWAALNGVTNYPKAIALDTGCVWGGTLTAYDVDKQARFTV